MTSKKIFLVALALALTGRAGLVSRAGATPTENLGLQVVPAPGPVVVDGRYDDWDLSGSVFASNDIETQRDDYAVWLCAMYDAKNLYLLARFQDKTPLDNPGQTIANYGFAGDSLQIRTITRPGTAGQLTCNLTAWRGNNGRDVVDVDYEGAKPGVRDAKTEGGQQAFVVSAGGRGYVQEIAVPWALLTKDGQPLRPGDRFQMTFEPNFTTPGKGRLSVKDVFQPVPAIDRVFTFMSKGEWGVATLAAKGRLAPRPVRVAGGREFPVRLQNGVPVADWSGLTAPGPAPALPGFKPITFTLPEDRYVSLNIKNAQGEVVCHLLRGAFYAKGRHTVLWDGLTTPNAHQPGTPVPAGAYTWSALSHGPVGLRWRGFADNGGRAPWDNGPDTNWGGDHGQPSACASEGDRVFLGWTAAEAGAALVATDLAGNVVWKNTRGGIAGAEQVAAGHGAVYVLNGPKDLYHLNAKDGAYLPWGAADSPSAPADVNPLALWPGADTPDRIDGLEVMGGQVFLSLAKQNGILVLDAKTGGFVKTIPVPAPGRLKAAADGHLLVVSGGKAVLSVDPAAGTTKTLVSGLAGAAAVAADAQGRVYVGLADPDNQVRVYDAAGRFLRAIGRPGGRALLGPWQPDGLRFLSGLAVDRDGKLWVAEDDDFPKRVSVWDTQTGKFVREFFGATHYGAGGGAINPRDPDVMVGSGCEWRLDPQTGRARCLAVITRDGMANSLFGAGANGRQYLVVANGSGFTSGPVQIFERRGDGRYALRGRFTYDTQGKTTRYWADADGDGAEQPSEVTTVPGVLKVGGWYMSVTPDLTLYSGYGQYKVAGFTPAGAPRYDLAHPVPLPNAGEQGGMGAQTGVGSADGRLILYNGAYQADRSTFDCYDIASGRRLWAYPNDYVGVHGSHNATPPEPGLIRGAYDIVGAATLPAPIGGIWVIPTNVGEWHILTGDGFYLTRLFQPDPMKYRFPADAAPGADMSNAPPGLGGEDFGGSVAQGTDGRLYVQAGKTGYWNLEVTGLETARAVPGGRLTLSRADLARSARLRADEQQSVSGPHALTVTRLTPTFTGDLARDFASANPVRYQKGEDTSATSAAAYDGRNLYLAWEVRDNTPWVNGATAPENLYLGGDTVDFQLGADAHAAGARSEAGAGDLRLSVGSLGGKNIAVLYRKVSPVKRPFVFHSGVIANYPMEYVAAVPEAKIRVVKRGDGYTVEATVPLAALGVTLQPGLTLSGDFGVTFSDPAGQRTRLRSYWSNQHTGIVDDAVYELMLEPKNWGRLTFGK